MAVTSLRIVFAGTPDVAVPTLEALAATEHDVVGVITRPDAPAGRGRHLKPSAISDTAGKLGLPTIKPEGLKDPAVLPALQGWHADIVVVVAYGLLIPASLLDLPRLGWINAHFSALPRWRGAAPVQRAIAHGDSTIAVTTFRIDEGLDTGPMLLQSPPTEIGDREEAGELLAHLAEVAARLVVDTVDGLADGSVAPIEQPVEGATYASRITALDARVDWNRPVSEVDRLIRACTPEPGAWSLIDGNRVRIGPAASVVIDQQAQPGRITAEKSVVRVGAQGGYLELGWVQPMGKKAMPAPDWARGFRGAVPEGFDQ